jgi:hypothetical protein
VPEDRLERMERKLDQSLSALNDLATRVATHALRLDRLEQAGATEEQNRARTAAEWRRIYANWAWGLVLVAASAFLGAVLGGHRP